MTYDDDPLLDHAIRSTQLEYVRRLRWLADQNEDLGGELAERDPNCSWSMKFVAQRLRMLADDNEKWIDQVAGKTIIPRVDDE